MIADLYALTDYGGVPDTRIDQFAAVRSKDRQGGSNSKKRAAERSTFLLLFTTKQVADCRTSYNLLNPQDCRTSS